jgi:hypothetical protein
MSTSSPRELSRAANRPISCASTSPTIGKRCRASRPAANWVKKWVSAGMPTPGISQASRCTNVVPERGLPTTRNSTP